MPDYVEPMRYEDAPYEELPYDAVLVVSFGGPEGPDDVMPFLENVLRGKNVPRERMLEVSEHYQHFGGVSPINEQCRQLIGALETELAEHGPNLPVYWGNRNWAPMLPDTLRQMEADGVKRAIAFFTSTFSCYSGCRQYRENIRDAQDVVGAGAPRIDKLRMPYNHPCFIDTNAEHLRQALEQIDPARRDGAKVLFTAHSIPMSMAENCKYERQLNEASRLTAEAAGHANWELVYQSRSGPPQQPWLEPDVCDRIEALHAEGGLNDLVLLPIGFVSDHMEVLFDLDTEAKELCDKLDVNLVRAATIGTHPRAVSMIRELIEERIATEREESPERPAVGQYPREPRPLPEGLLHVHAAASARRGPPGWGGPSDGGVGMSEVNEEPRPLGDSGVAVTPVALGCWPMAGVTTLGATHADGVATVHAALDAGVNHFDTAYVYGPNGESDAILAEALEGRRDEVVIASKVGIHYDEVVAGQKPEMSQDARPETLRRECDELLGRLKTDPRRPALPALARPRGSGRGVGGRVGGAARSGQDQGGWRVELHAAADEGVQRGLPPRRRPTPLQPAAA